MSTPKDDLDSTLLADGEDAPARGNTLPDAQPMVAFVG